MKKMSLMFTLLLLICVELYLCAAFLPARWQASVSQSLSRVLPHRYDYSAVTHPALDLEVEQALRHRPALELGIYIFIVLLIAVNTFAIVKILGILRRQMESHSLRH